jgi:hypothetical protein
MGFTWYLLGLLTTGSTIFLWHFSKRYQFNWLSWAGLSLGIVLTLFSIAWSVGSVLEGVPRAASMGLLLFGFSGIVILTLASRYTLTKRPKMLKPAAEPALSIEVETHVAPKKEKPAKASVVGPYISVIVRYAAYISLAIALVIGLASEGKDYEGMVRNKFKDQQLTKVNDNPVVFQLGAKGDGPGNYVLIQEGQGYGGPFVLGIRIMEDGKIHEIMPLDHKETPAFVKKIEKLRMPDTATNLSLKMSAMTLSWGWISMLFPGPRSPPWPLSKPSATAPIWLRSKSLSWIPNGKKCLGNSGWMKS